MGKGRINNCEKMEGVGVPCEISKLLNQAKGRFCMFLGWLAIWQELKPGSANDRFLPIPIFSTVEGGYLKRKIG